jgi:hypothetical protein
MTGAAVELLHGGGIGNVPKRILEIITNARLQEIPPRLVVMVDSDASYVGQLSGDAESVKSLCAEHSVSCLVLSCRTAENYIPIEAYKRWAAKPDNKAARPQVEALEQLNPDQLDHFPIKGRKKSSKGMAAIDRPEAHPEAKKLFEDIQGSTRGALCGFQDDIILKLLPDYLPLPDERASANTKAEPANDEWVRELSARDRRDDLRMLVSLIEASL